MGIVLDEYLRNVWEKILLLWNKVDIYLLLYSFLFVKYVLNVLRIDVIKLIEDKEEKIEKLK